MIELYLTSREGTKDITALAESVQWSGDKASVCRKITVSLLHREDRGWPTPEEGDVMTLTDGEGTLFTGLVVRSSQDSEDERMSCVCYDRGVYLRNNDGTYNFRGAGPETIARQVCADHDIPVAELAATGIRLDRKFSGVPLDKIITTAYSLAADQTGERYAVAMTAEGLRVRTREQSAASINLRPRSNLIRASTIRSIEHMVNAVAILDAQGQVLDTISDQAAVDLYGQMRRHITQRSGEDAAARARAMLEDGARSQTVTVEVLGDRRLITGETVVVEEESTGLQGIFWIDADTHVWKNNIYRCKLTLNCRSVMVKSNAGSDLK